MKITYDKDSACTYVKLSNKKIKHTKSEGDYYIDLAEDGSIVGIEYLKKPSIKVNEDKKNYSVNLDKKHS